MAPALRNKSEVRLTEEQDVDVLDTGGPDGAIVPAENNGADEEWGVARAQVIEAIINDPVVAEHLGYEPLPPLAADVIDWLSTLVQECRDNDYYPVYPTDDQMQTEMYRIFDSLMPHGVKAPEPGSTADLLAKHVLDPTKDETSLWHDREYDEEESAYYCSVQVALGVIR